jgi:hypothetical protein
MPTEKAMSVRMFSMMLRKPKACLVLMVQHVALTVWSHIKRISVHCSRTVRTQPIVYTLINTRTD